MHVQVNTLDCAPQELRALGVTVPETPNQDFPSSGSNAPFKPGVRGRSPTSSLMRTPTCWTSALPELATKRSLHERWPTATPPRPFAVAAVARPDRPSPTTSAAADLLRGPTLDAPTSHRWVAAVLQRGSKPSLPCYLLRGRPRGFTRSQRRPIRGWVDSGTGPCPVVPGPGGGVPCPFSLAQAQAD